MPTRRSACTKRSSSGFTICRDSLTRCVVASMHVGQRAFPDLRDVRNISIQGDRAVGYLNPPPVKAIRQEPANNRQPVHFCKIDGVWYLTIPDPPPPLSARERATKLQAESETLWVLLCCSTKAVVVPTEPGKPEIVYPHGLKPYGELRMSVLNCLFTGTPAQPFIWPACRRHKPRN